MNGRHMNAIWKQDMTLNRRFTVAGPNAGFGSLGELKVCLHGETARDASQIFQIHRYISATGADQQDMRAISQEFRSLRALYAISKGSSL